MLRWLLAVLVLPTVASAALAQDIASPAAPMLVKSTYAPLGLYAPDAVTPLFLSINPAAAALATRLAHAEQGAEFDYIAIGPKNGPSVSVPISSVFFRVGQVDMRLSYYDISSGTAPALVSEGLPVKFGGNAWEISAATLLSDGKGAVGVAFLPRDESWISIGDGLVSGRAESRLQARAGVLHHLDERRRWTGGLVISYEDDDAYVDVSPLLTGLPEIVKLNGDYLIRTGIAGLTYQPRVGTTVFANYTYQTIKGPDVDRSVKVPYYGVTQFFNPRAGVSLGYVDAGKTASIFYADKRLQASLGYTYKSFQTVRQYVGRSNTLWVTLSYAR